MQLLLKSYFVHTQKKNTRIEKNHKISFNPQLYNPLNGKFVNSKKKNIYEIAKYIYDQTLQD